VARRFARLAPPELIVGTLGVGVFIVWGIDGGGSEPTSWYPGALFFLGLLAVALVTFVMRPRVGWTPPSRAVLIALALLGAFAAWNLLSITWADVKGDAWDGANRTLLYFTVFAVCAIPTWRALSAAIILGLFAFGIACVAAGTMIDINSAADPALSFIGGNLIDPTGYHNSTAALFLVAFFPAAFLASRPEVPWPLRGVMLASAGVLVEMAIPAQSRGAAIVFPLGLILYFAVMPNRVRALVWVLPVGVTAALAAPSLLDIYSTIQDGGDLPDAVSQATSALLVSAAGLLLVGAAAAAIDKAADIPTGVQRQASRVAGVATAVAAVVAIVVALNATGDPVDWAQARWDDFKGGSEHDFGSSRFTGDLGTNRYDFWRVGLDEFTDRPLTGVGSENFAVDYLRDRESAEEPQHPHSLEIRLLAQTGIVGSVLFAGFLVLVVWAIARVRRHAADRLTCGVAAVSLTVAAYWLLHASADWLWVFPAITAPALGFLAMAARLDDGPDGDDPAPPKEVKPRTRTPAQWAVAGVVGVALLFAAVSYVLPLVAAGDLDVAAAGWRADPEDAFDRLDQASDLNFLSDEPDVVAGAIAERLGNYRRMRVSFEEAIDRNPYNWYSLMELGALDAVEGDRTAALSRLRAAAELNPGEELIQGVLQDVQRGRPVRLRALDRALLGRVCARFGQTQATGFCK
jgi:hypothetical protein